MKRKLISPACQEEGLYGVKTLRSAPLNLAIIASLTPSKYEVSLIDENIEGVDFDADDDIVGVTVIGV